MGRVYYIFHNPTTNKKVTSYIVTCVYNYRVIPTIIISTQLANCVAILPTVQVLRDWHLGLVILCITGIGCGLGVLHVAVPQLRIDAMLTEDPGYGVGRDVCSHLCDT